MLLSVLLVVSVLMATGCKSETELSTNVYVAGLEYGISKAVAKVWKNGVELYLTDGTTDTVFEGIAVVNE